MRVSSELFTADLGDSDPVECIEAVEAMMIAEDIIIQADGEYYAMLLELSKAC